MDRSVCLVVDILCIRYSQRLRILIDRVLLLHRPGEPGLRPYSRTGLDVDGKLLLGLKMRVTIGPEAAVTMLLGKTNGTLIEVREPGVELATVMHKTVSRPAYPSITSSLREMGLFVVDR